MQAIASRKKDLVVGACKTLIKNACTNLDRVVTGVFNDYVEWHMNGLVLYKDGYVSSLDNFNARGNTRLYDSLCSSVNYMYERAIAPRPWAVVVVFCNNDNKSVLSADKCADYILSKKGNNYVILVSVGGDIRTDEIDDIALRANIEHWNVSSLDKLADALFFKVACGAVGAVDGPVDYAFVLDASEPMNSFVQSKAGQTMLQPRSPTSSAHSGAQSVHPRYPMLQDSPAHSAGQGVPLPVHSDARDVQSGISQPGSAASSMLISAFPEAHMPSSSASASMAPVQPAAAIRIRMREFINKHTHQLDRGIFGEFALQNYPSISTDWEEDEIEFLVLVESRESSIVGLLVMEPCNVDQVHIRLMVVDSVYRGHGLGTEMLTHVAKKYTDKRITLNVDFEHVELLAFYVLKGYATLYDVSARQKVLMLCLNPAGLFARIPLPE